MSNQPNVQMTVSGTSSSDKRADPAAHNRLILQRYSMLKDKVMNLSADLVEIATEQEERSVATVAMAMSNELRTIVNDVAEWTPPEELDGD